MTTYPRLCIAGIALVSERRAIGGDTHTFFDRLSLIATARRSDERHIGVVIFRR